MWCPEILPGIYVKPGTSASEPPPDPLSKAQTMSSSLHPAHFRKKKKSHMQVSCTKPSGIPFSLTTASQGEPSTIISRFPTDEINALLSPHPLLPCCPRFMFWFSSAFSSLQSAHSNGRLTFLDFWSGYLLTVWIYQLYSWIFLYFCTFSCNRYLKNDSMFSLNGLLSGIKFLSFFPPPPSLLFPTETLSFPPYRALAIFIRI